MRKQRQKTEETFYFAPNDEEDLELEEEEEVEDDDDEEYTAPTAASRPKVRTKRPGQGTNVRGGFDPAVYFSPNLSIQKLRSTFGF